MLDKASLEKMLQHSLKVKKVLFIISMCLYGLAAAFLATYIALKVSGYDILLMPDYFEDITLTLVLFDFFSTALSGAIVTLLFSRLIFARRAIVYKAMLDNYDQTYAKQAQTWNSKPSATPIVDVKPIEKPKGKYDDLINEYQKLYEQGLISKESFEAKKKELESLN